MPSEPSVPNVGAIFGRRNITHVASGPSIFDRDIRRNSSSRSHIPAVTAVFNNDSDDDDLYGTSDEEPKHPRQCSPPSRDPTPNRRRSRRSNDDASPSPRDCSSVASVVSAPTRTRTVSNDSAADCPPFRSKHFWWTANVDNLRSNSTDSFKTLLDDGSPFVLIRSDVADSLGLRMHKLQHPEPYSGAFDSTCKSITHYVKLCLHDLSNAWSSRTSHALVVSSLAVPILLGIPFLSHNNLVIDYAARSCVHKPSGFDLLNPLDTLPVPPALPLSPHEKRKILKTRIKNSFADKKVMIAELKVYQAAHPELSMSDHVLPVDVVAAVCARIEILEDSECCAKLSGDIIAEYSDVFQKIPHVNELPNDDGTCKIRLKTNQAKIQARTYQSPRKYNNAWHTLIKQHEDAGRIRRSNSEFSLPAFLVPKTDPSALPRWVNDYRILNANVVDDRHPLPRIDSILADCAKGKIWGKMDMTDSFFQNRIHEDSIPLTAVTTPLGLYEWLVMPQGLKIAPAVHQRRVSKALQEYIGKFCHVYINDIIIWSNSEEEHCEHVRLILEALRKNKLFMNPKKCKFFLNEVDFLGHHISQRGIKAQQSKCDAILHFPRPESAKEVRRFLGMVCFIAGYLSELLAEHTAVLYPLTRKECNSDFPEWDYTHEKAFSAIKTLIVECAVLTSIDHENPGDNKMFLVTDASDLRTGGVLMWGPTLDTARPVAFDSSQLSGPELNYPVHEKELLAIVQCLKKWRADCLGSHIYVLTDHRTLENFTSQHDLSRRQLRWQEDLSQFELSIAYIKGEDNEAADALSQVKLMAFPWDTQPIEPSPLDQSRIQAWINAPCVASVLSISADISFLNDIKEGYMNDAFCNKLVKGGSLVPGIEHRDGLWYVNNRLYIPKYKSLREELFRLAHDALGHFGADKSYDNLVQSYYWPKMRQDLYTAYVPSCNECQQNKSKTSGHGKGPLHPLPVPDHHAESIAMDFVGPLPEEDGFDCVLTITDRLGSDLRIIPLRMDATAEDVARLFFDTWYCENGLPLDIVCDRDKLFVSKFWKSLTQLSGVKVKMSSAFHPETDGSSERTNKTFNQCVRYYVERNQRGWVRAIPHICFNIMNSINASTGLSMFNIKMGRTPRVIPPLIKDNNKNQKLEPPEAFLARIRDIELQAKDSLTAAKVQQAFQADKNRSPSEIYEVGDLVMLTTLHRHNNFKKAGENRAAKFFPRYDGPYEVIKAHPESSYYTLDMPNQPNTFPSFHVDVLKRYHSNDPELFPGRELHCPPPTIVDGHEEYDIDRILDSRRRGRGWQFLVRWVGQAPSEDRWLSYASLKDCAALDTWVIQGGDGPADLLDSVDR
jgi:hypothetical protein